MTLSLKVKMIFFLKNIKFWLILFQNWLPSEQWTIPLEKVGQGKNWQHTATLHSLVKQFRQTIWRQDKILCQQLHFKHSQNTNKWGCGVVKSIEDTFFQDFLKSLFKSISYFSCSTFSSHQLFQNTCDVLFTA